MKFSLPALLFSAFLFGVPASVQAQEGESTDNAEAEEEPEVDPDQRIRCETRRVTGSNARRIRTCMTIAQWREMARDGNRDARRALRNAGACPSPDAGC